MVVVVAAVLDVDGARGVAVVEVEVAAVVDEGAFGGGAEVELAADVAPLRVGGFVPAALVAPFVLHAAMLIRPVARRATPTPRRS